MNDMRWCFGILFAWNWGS